MKIHCKTPPNRAVFFYMCITLCITVFGVFGAWGGIGLELHTPNKIKTAHPAIKLRLVQNSKERANPKKRTVWCVINGQPLSDQHLLVLRLPPQSIKKHRHLPVFFINSGLPHEILMKCGGWYWTRTNDLYDVNVTL